MRFAFYCIFAQFLHIFLIIYFFSVPVLLFCRTFFVIFIIFFLNLKLTYYIYLSATPFPDPPKPLPSASGLLAFGCASLAPPSSGSALPGCCVVMCCVARVTPAP